MNIGDRVRLTKDIWDDGADHHPPGTIAHEGDIVIVKQVSGETLDVAHFGNPGAFVVYAGEYEVAP